jgi:WD40 repeat protein
MANRAQERCFWCRDLVGSVVMLPDRKTLVSGADDGSVCFRDAFGRPRPPANTDLVVSPRMGLLAEVDAPESKPAGGSSTRGNVIQLWNLAARQETLSFHGEELGFVHLTFSPDGIILAATGMSGIAHLWRAPSGEEIEAGEKQQAAR